jgi:hypothetical protein
LSRNLRFASIFWLAAIAGPFSYGQTACPGVNFRTESSANLAPGGASHIRLARQSDGSYTGYEIADAAPYGTVGITPDFQNQLTACSLTNSSYQFTPPEAIARLGSGNYLYVGNNAGVFGQTGTVRALLFDAGFHFLSENDYPANGVLALADLNGDGALDIIAGSQIGPNAGVTVLLGNGGTSFQAPAVYGATAFLQIAAIAVGDLDGDGKLDVVVAAIGANNPGTHIFVLYGNGDGTLQAPVALATSWGNQGVAIGDVNRDGVPDLVFTVGAPQDGNPNYVEVMLGRGGRTFGDPVAYPTGGSGAVAIGDVDGDGNPDIVTNGVTVYFGDGKGGFPRRRDWFNDAPGSIILTDFGGDGKIDIVLGTGNAQVLAGNRVTVLFNRGGGDFSGAPVSAAYTLNYGIQQIEIADLNRDGIPDVVLTDLSQIFVLLGNRDGTFRQVWVLGQASGVYASQFTVGDFNGDGIPDLAMGLGNASGINVAVFLGRGDGTFQQASLTSFPQPIGGLAAGDFNGDGKLDLAVLSNGPGWAVNDAVTVYLGDGKGGLGAPVSYPVGPVAMAIAAGDFNRDGRADIAVAAAGAYQVNNGEITVLLSTGSGFARSAVPMGADSPYTVTTADLNGDGVPDLEVQCESGRAAIVLGRDNGTFGTPTFLAETAPAGIFSTVGFAAADVNGDGHMDLIGWGGNPGIFLGNGDGTFQPQIPLPEDYAPFAANMGGRLPELVMGDGLTGVAAFLKEPLARPALPPRRSRR